MGSYGRLSTAFYDLDKPAAPRDAVAFYRRRAAQAIGPVLEPMCGSGRFLLPLLQAGIPIEGVDASAEMLTACRLKAADLGLVPKLYEQSLEELALPRRYGFAFVPSGSLGLIHRMAGLRAGLRRLRRHLCPNATLFLELMAAETFEPTSAGAGARSVDTGDGRSIRYAWRSTSDPGRRTVHYDSRYQLSEDDKVLAEESESLVLRMYTAEEVLHELHLAGFSDGCVVPTTDDMAWLRESECHLYECKVPASEASS